MTWTNARAAFIAALEVVPDLDLVLAAPPASGAALRNGVTALLTPPGRTTVRRAGCDLQRTYRQHVTVTALLGTNPEHATPARRRRRRSHRRRDGTSRHTRRDRHQLQRLRVGARLRRRLPTRIGRVLRGGGRHI